MIITQLSDCHLTCSDYAFPCNSILTGAINKELGLNYKMLEIPKNINLSTGQGNWADSSCEKQKVGLFDSANVQDCNRTCKEPTKSVMSYKFFSINQETTH